MRQQKNSSSSKGQNFWIEAIQTVGLSLIFAFGIRGFAAQAFNVASGSMIPTLLVNDKFVVDKVTYNFREPQREDIVVFYPTEALKKENFDDYFIKRVIGLPGEKVELKQGQVYINNQLLAEENYLGKGQWTTAGICGAKNPYLSQKVTIPADSYLVLGDNRMNSYDGRCWGVVPRKNIMGRAVIRFWPLNHISGFSP